MNASEEYLGRLAQETFLSVWSYQNLYRDVAKELADLVVLCGNIVVIFSDKRVRFQEDIPLPQAWQRWYNRAVISSMKQLKRASGWIQRHPNRIYLDAKCTQQVTAFDHGEELEVFRIAVANGAADACLRHFKQGSGSLVVSPHENPKNPEPFSIGNPAGDDDFVHVFDEAHLHIVLQELDTITDFVEYLRSRQRLIDGGHLAVAASEEDLLAVYLKDVNEDGLHDWVIDSGKALTQGEFVAVQEGAYNAFREAPEYVRKKLADRASYFWDNLIESFATNLRNNNLVRVPETLGAKDGRDGGAEFALRYMALEHRLARRNLSEAFHDAFYSLERHGGNRFFRAVLDDKKKRETGFCFLLLKREAVPDDVSYREYREFRAAMLSAYAEGIAERNRQLKRVVGIATEGELEGTRSEDLVLFEQGNWSAESIENLRQREAGFEIFRSEMDFNPMGSDEYPDKMPLGPSYYRPIPYQFSSPPKPKNMRKVGGNRRERRAAAARKRKTSRRR